MYVPAAAIRNAERCVEASVAPADPSAGQVSVRAALVFDWDFVNKMSTDADERIAEHSITYVGGTQRLKGSCGNIQTGVS